MELKTEVRKIILVRVPPGDSWKFQTTDTVEPKIYNNLTKALDAWYQVTGDTTFWIDARRGVVEIVENVITTPILEKYSLYGEK